MAVLGTCGMACCISRISSHIYGYVAAEPCCVSFLLIYRIEESLTMIRGLGLQTSTTSSTYLQTPTTRFIPTTSIQDVFIHEAFKGFEVRFYLMIVVEGEGEVVVVFPTLLPMRDVLEVVWRGVRGSLWEGDREKALVEEMGEKDRVNTL